MLGLRRRRPHRRSTAFENVLGTSLEVVVTADEADLAEAAESAVLDQIERLDGVFSTYRESEFTAFLASDGWRSVSPDLATVLGESEAWRLRSDAVFLPTVESVMQAWREGEVSTPLDRTQPLWEVDLAGSRARRLTTAPATLNSIAKGYIIDQAAESGFKMAGVRQVMVNLGGDIRHLGEGRLRTQITDPFAAAENAEPAAVIEVRQGGIASSGGYRRGLMREGKWHSHLVDPRSGEPVSDIASASVWAPTAMEADVLATIASVFSPQEAFPRFFSESGRGVFVITSGGRYFANRQMAEALRRSQRPVEIV